MKVNLKLALLHAAGIVAFIDQRVDHVVKKLWAILSTNNF